jgi:hypothetical protein
MGDRNAHPGGPNMSQTRRYLLLGSGIVLLAAAFLISCYPGDELTVSDTNTVVTVFAKNTDFSGDSTYAMPDTVIHLVSEGDKDDISRAYDATILSDIVSNMDALGYTRVSDPAAADVHILTAVSVRDYTGYAYYGGYWGYWYGYYPTWGWYPYYPSGGVTYSYSVGTIFIMMTDPHQASSADKPAPPIWIAALNGLVDTGTNASRISKGIDQAFAQSQYLGEGK